MKIAVMSDTHDHIWHTQQAVEQANELGAEMILHCGDLVSPFALEEFDGFAGQFHLVSGNNPGDQALLERMITRRKERFFYHGLIGKLSLLDFKIAWTHDPQTGFYMAKSGEFDLVAFGHTHRWHLEKVNETTLLNPGEIMGRKEVPGWAMVELQRSDNIKTISVTQIKLK